MNAAAKLGSVQQVERPLDFAGRHYSPAEIAELWSLSVDTVRKLFENEPGVLVIESCTGRYRKRRYRTLRIPQHVLERVHRRMTKV